MLKLVIPPPLAQEFATVEALWRSGAETRRVDSLLLCWVKHEKQLRRLFCFLVYQHHAITGATISAVITAMAKRNNLYPDTLIRGVQALGIKSVPALVGPKHAQLRAELERIKRYRNKLIHGQVTGQAVQSRQLEADVKHLIEWVHCLAVGANAEFGYDGLGRNTFKAAKASAGIAVTTYPFTSTTGFGAWIRTLSGGS